MVHFTFADAWSMEWRFTKTRDERGYMRTPLPVFTDKDTVKLFARAANRAGMGAWIAHNDVDRACEQFLPVGQIDWVLAKIDQRFRETGAARINNATSGWALVYYTGEPTEEQIDSLVMFLRMLG